MWKKRQTPSQPHKRTTTTYFLTLTFYSFADFFFLTAFPWELTIGISLPYPSFRLAVSHPSPSFFSVLIVISALFALLWWFVQGRASTQSAFCMQKDFINIFVAFITSEILTAIFLKYCIIPITVVIYCVLSLSNQMLVHIFLYVKHFWLLKYCLELQYLKLSISICVARLTDYSMSLALTAN